MPLFTLVYAKSRNETVRVGFSVSKRIGNAVQRNRAKRRMRAALTPMLLHISGSCNVIFVAKPSVLDAPFSELGNQMETLLRRAGLWRDEA
jgi:ribonuclease P protein component